MERKEAIRGAYRMTGENNFYDGMIPCQIYMYFDRPVKPVRK